MFKLLSFPKEHLGKIKGHIWRLDEVGWSEDWWSFEISSDSFIVAYSD